MRPYICISYAPADQDTAQSILRELTRYGFYCETPDSTLSRRAREAMVRGAVCFLALTSPAAEADGSVAADIRLLLGEGRSVVCLTLEKNALDDRFCRGGIGTRTADCILYPAGEAPDRAQTAFYLHRLYLSRLCRFSAAFSAVRCVDDANGRLIKQAVLAHRAYSREEFARREERNAAIRATYDLAHAYRTGAVAPRLEREAALWLERGAELEYTDSLLDLANWKLAGGDLPLDPAGAMELFSRAARAGSVRGYYQMGRCALLGIGMLRDPSEAASYFTEAAARGYLPAYYRLGQLKRDGVGLPADRYGAARDLYAACAELTGYRIPTTDIHFVPQAAGETVRIVEPRPARDLRQGPAGLHPHRVYRVLSMRQLRDVRLRDLLGLPKDAPLQACMARCRFRLTHESDSQRLRRILPASPATEPSADNWSHYDPAPAAYELGLLLEQGNGTPACPPLPLHALYWYRLAARQGHSGAILRLAECHRNGRGTLPTLSEAVELYRLAAEQGHAEAQFRLGVCFEQGIDLEPNISEAMRWYTEAARQDYAPALHNLGSCLERGINGRRDMSGAVDHYRRASALGESAATCRLGLCYERGNGVPQNADRALELFQQATEAGHPYAAYRLGLCYDWGRATTPQLARAAQLYARAATAGIPEAAYALGLCYEEGRGVPRDAAQAYSWFAMAAASCPQAALAAGLALLGGQGVVRKPEAAQAYFRTAAADRIPTRKETPWLQDLLTTPDIRPRMLDGNYSSPIEDTAEEISGDLPRSACTKEQAAGEALYYLALDLTVSESDRISRLTCAARLENARACLALGDLYASEQLIHSDLAPADAARVWYEKALDCAQTQRNTQAAVKAEIYLRLAQDEVRRGDVCRAAEDAVADSWYRSSWKCLIGAVKHGSATALIRMARYAYLGIGTSPSSNRAQSLLQTLRQQHGHGYDSIACLWLGCLCLEGETPDPVGAAKLFLEAVQAPRPIEPPRTDATGDPCPDMQQASAEAMYRLALLLSTSKALSAHSHNDTPLLWACQAALAGHPAARSDLTRALSEGLTRWTTARQRLEASLDMLQKKQRPDTTDGDHPPIRSLGKLARGIRAEMADLSFDPGEQLLTYYRAPRPAPAAFVFTQRTAEAVRGEEDEAIAFPDATPRAEAEVMNYIGECLFRGQHLPEDRAAAVAFYRMAAAFTPGRGEPPCEGALWAQYSLGWCLIRGVGCTADPEEGVEWLTRAARQHGEAAFMLAECCEQGIGMDAPDKPTAVTYYRRALRLGCRGALGAQMAMDKALRNS